MPRTVLITGASSGIGKELTSLLLEKNRTVIGMARDFSKCSFREHPLFHAVPVDLSSLEGLAPLLRDLTLQYGDADALVLNAGIGLFGGLEEYSYEQIETITSINFLSAVFITRAFLPLLKKKKRGVILFTGSEAALAGKAKGSLYCATKFALRGFAQALRHECAKSGIRVCLIHPGPVQTPFFTRLRFCPENDPDYYCLPEEIARLMLDQLEGRPGFVQEEIIVSPLKRAFRSH